MAQKKGALVWVAEIINQAHFKAPGDGVDFPWHQDSVNRGYHTGKFLDVHGNRSYVNIAVAIDAETADNGPLSVYEGKTHDHCWHLGCILPRVPAITVSTGTVRATTFESPLMDGIGRYGSESGAQTVDARQGGLRNAVHGPKDGSKVVVSEEAVATSSSTLAWLEFKDVGKIGVCDWSGDQ